MTHEIWITYNSHSILEVSTSKFHIVTSITGINAPKQMKYSSRTFFLFFFWPLKTFLWGRILVNSWKWCNAPTIAISISCCERVSCEAFWGWYVCADVLSVARFSQEENYKLLDCLSRCISFRTGDVLEAAVCCTWFLHSFVVIHAAFHKLVDSVKQR